MRNFQPASYICSRCTTEHNGSAHALPRGWGILRTIHGDRNGSAVCEDCLLHLGKSLPARPRRDRPRPLDRPTTGMVLGIVAAAFAGVLIPASSLPAREARQ